MILRHQPLHIHRPQHHLLTVNRLQSHPSGLLLLPLPSIKLKSFSPSHTPLLFLSPICSRFKRDSFTPSSQYLEKASIASLTSPNRETEIYTICVSPPSL